VWVVARPGKKDALIPYIDAVVKEINVADKTIKIHIMEGLLDE
ncbi:ribosome maturation factor RimM, partial [Bacillus licheniformis]|nr:ribosome maturation factor RimM [Bacillus licheniformis]